MQTRREIIKSGLGLAGIIAAGKAPAALVRSLIAARSAMVGGAKGWKNPYVTDGLVAMWDGQWNAGGGVHDPNSTVWKDLVGNKDLTLRSSASFGTNCLNNNSTTSSATTAISGISGIYSFEVGFVANNTNAVILSVGDGLYCYNGPSKLWCNGTNANDKRNSICSYTVGQVACMTFLTDGSSNTVIKAYDKGIDITSFGSLDWWLVGNVLSVGGHYSTTDSSRSLSGSVFYVRLYSRVLTAAEIAANYAVDKERFGLT